MYCTCTLYLKFSLVKDLQHLEWKYVIKSLHGVSRGGRGEETKILHSAHILVCGTVFSIPS